MGNDRLRACGCSIYAVYCIVPPSGKEVVKALRKLGWDVVSQKGSHVKLSKGDRTLIVPIHGNHDLGKGLISALEKQSGEKLR